MDRLRRVSEAVLSGSAKVLDVSGDGNKGATASPWGKHHGQSVMKVISSVKTDLLHRVSSQGSNSIYSPLEQCFGNTAFLCMACAKSNLGFEHTQTQQGLWGSLSSSLQQCIHLVVVGYNTAISCCYLISEHGGFDGSSSSV